MLLNIVQQCYSKKQCYSISYNNVTQYHITIFFNIKIEDPKSENAPNLDKSDEKPSEKPKPKPNPEKTPTEPTVKPKPAQKTLFELMRKNENTCEEGNKTKPVNKPKPNPNQTNTTKPAQTTRLSRKLKTTAVKKSELKLFLEKKKKQKTKLKN